MRLDDDLKFFESEEFKATLAIYESAHDVGSQAYMEADELTDIAEYYSMVCHDEGRADEAINLALQLHPDAVDPQVFKARQYMLAGEIGTAEELCNAIEDQQHREVYFLRAELLIRQDYVKQAATMLMELMETIDEDRDYFLYDSAYVFVDYRLYEQAQLFANLLEEMAPDWYKTWQVMADVHLGLENNSVALNYIERMLDVDPFSTEAWNWSAEAQCGLSQFNEALNSIEYALAVDPENERAFQLKAWILMQSGRFVEALQLYEKLIAWSPDNEQNWLYTSYCLLSINRLDDAVYAIERAESLAQEMSTEQAGIYEQHAQILSRKGDVEGALACLDKAQNFFVPEDDLLDLDLLRARVEAENGNPDIALNYIHQAYNHNEDHHLEIYLMGAMIFFDCEYFEVAKDMFLELADHSSSDMQNASNYAYIAYCFMQLKDENNVLKYLKLAAAAPDKLRELFADEFPNVQPDEYYDYYYYRVYGQWPNAAPI